MLLSSRRQTDPTQSTLLSGGRAGSTGKSRSVSLPAFGDASADVRLGIPDATARLSILNVLLSRTPHSLTQVDLRAVADRAHGYVGADLSAVVREAGTSAIKRWLASQPSGSAFARPPPGPRMSSDAVNTHATEDASGGIEDAPELTQTDLLLALPNVRPSALRSLYLPGTETPVKYADVGGLGDVIQKLRECVEWPLQYPGVSFNGFV